MSVLIKGMEMPSDCEECWLMSICDESIHLTKRPIDCPLIELPPHGRLIDADALFFTDFTLTQIALEKGNPFKNLAIAIFEKIESAPTILEAEVNDG